MMIPRSSLTPPSKNSSRRLATDQSLLRQELEAWANIKMIPDMTEAEALKLLFQSSQAKYTDQNLQAAARIVQRLGFHALAIDQAGAYIRARSLPEIEV
jgi:hypothetical protein